jgi:hypothetical protein
LCGFCRHCGNDHDKINLYSPLCRSALYGVEFHGSRINILVSELRETEVSQWRRNLGGNIGGEREMCCSLQILPHTVIIWQRTANRAAHDVRRNISSLNRMAICGSLLIRKSIFTPTPPKVRMVTQQTGDDGVKRMRFRSREFSLEGDDLPETSEVNRFLLSGTGAMNQTMAMGTGFQTVALEVANYVWLSFGIELGTTGVVTLLQNRTTAWKLITGIAVTKAMEVMQDMDFVLWKLRIKEGSWRLTDAEWLLTFTARARPGELVARRSGGAQTSVWLVDDEDEPTCQITSGEAEYLVGRPNNEWLARFSKVMMECGHIEPIGWRWRCTHCGKTVEQTDVDHMREHADQILPQYSGKNNKSIGTTKRVAATMDTSGKSPQELQEIFTVGRLKLEKRYEIMNREIESHYTWDRCYIFGPDREDEHWEIFRSLQRLRDEIGAEISRKEELNEKNKEKIEMQRQAAKEKKKKKEEGHVAGVFKEGDKMVMVIRKDFFRKENRGWVRDTVTLRKDIQRKEEADGVRGGWKEKWVSDGGIRNVIWSWRDTATKQRIQSSSELRGTVKIYKSEDILAPKRNRNGEQTAAGKKERVPIRFVKIGDRGEKREKAMIDRIVLPKGISVTADGRGLQARMSRRIVISGNKCTIEFGKAMSCRGMTVREKMNLVVKLAGLRKGWEDEPFSEKSRSYRTDKLARGVANSH